MAHYVLIYSEYRHKLQTEHVQSKQPLKIDFSSRNLFNMTFHSHVMNVRIYSDMCKFICAKLNDDEVTSSNGSFWSVNLMGFRAKYRNSIQHFDIFSQILNAIVLFPINFDVKSKLIRICIYRKPRLPV